MNRHTPANAAPQPIKGSWEDLFNQAQRLARNQNDDAIPAYRRLVDGLFRLPQSQRLAGQERLQSLLLQSAMAFHSYLNLRDRYDESLEILSRLQLVVGEHEKNALVPHMVDILLQAGRHEDAYEMQRQRAESPDGTLQDWGNLAMAYVRTGQPQKALEAIAQMESVTEHSSPNGDRSAENAQRDTAYKHGMRAIVSLECHDWEDGMAAFEKAMEDSDTYFGSVHLLYSRLVFAGLYDDALRYISQDTSNPIRAAWWRGTVLSRQGKTEDARRVWRNVTRLEPEQQVQDNLFEYVLCHYSLGDKEGKGLGIVLGTIREQPSVPWIYLFLAGIGWALRGDLDTAANDLELAQAQHKASAQGTKLPSRLWLMARTFLDDEATSRLNPFFETENAYQEG